MIILVVLQRDLVVLRKMYKNMTERKRINKRKKFNFEQINTRNFTLLILNQNIKTPLKCNSISKEKCLFFSFYFYREFSTLTHTMLLESVTLYHHKLQLLPQIENKS